MARLPQLIFYVNRGMARKSSTFHKYLAEEIANSSGFRSIVDLEVK